MKKVISGSILVMLTFGLVACGGGENSQNKQNKSMDAAADSQQTVTASPPEAKLNMNTSTEEEFRTIPGVGDKMVHEFFEYRPYISIVQFRKEIGKYVDEEQVAAYEKYIFVPITINESDAASLQQIPGVDAGEAEQLVSARPYDSRQAFLDKLGTFVNKEQLATAKTYLKNQ